jgi:uncharacterized protein (TIGR02099 family)
MKLLTRRLFAWLLRLGLLGLILLAVLMTVLRLALPVADRYRDELTRALSGQLHYPLQVATLRLRLAGWSPRLVLDNVVISCPQTGADLLRLDALELDLDPIASLVAWQPRLRSLTLVGAHLAVHRALDGRLSLVGLGALRPDDPDALRVFLSQGQLNLTGGDILIIDDAAGGAVVRLTQVRLRLHNDGPLHQFELFAHPVPAATPTPTPTPTPAAPDDTRLRVLADLRGDAADTRQWGGQVYLSLNGADLAPLVPWTLLDPDLLRSRSVHLESWNQVEQGVLRESLNRVGMRAVTLRLPGGGAATGGAGRPATAPAAAPATAATAALSLDRLDGLVRVTPQDGGWRLQAAELGLAVDGAGFPDLELDLRLSADRRPRALAFGSAGFDLQAVTGPLLRAWPRSLAAPGPLDPTLLAALNPRGRVERLAALVLMPPAGAPTWQVAAQVRGLALERHAPLPGLTGLDAQLRADQDGGLMTLGSAGLQLDLRPLFDPPLRLERLGGELAWVRDPTGAWRLTGTHLTLANPDLTGQARFTLVLPGPADTASDGPVIDLRASIQDANVAATRRYLPVGVLHPQLIDWLTRALVSGTVTRGDLVLRGPLKHYPFRAQEGIFELLLNYRTMVLDYLPDWPPITAATGHLRFLDEGLEIQLDRGRIYETTLSQGRAGIPDLWHPRRLAIHAQGSGPFADGLKVLTDTPLAQHLGPLGRSLEVTGHSQLALDLEVPLEPGGTLGLDGRLSWPAPAGLTLRGTPVQLTGLAGDLRSTLDSVSAPAIRAKLWGRPLTLAISTSNPGDPESAATRIQARARMPAALLAARFPSPFWRLASGDLDWDLGIEVRNTDVKTAALPLGFTLRSDLRGLTLDLPAPLGKTAAPPRPLELTGALVPGRRLSITGRMEPLAWDLNLDLAGPRPRLEGARVTLGEARATPPTAPGLVIDGALPAFDLPAWSDWWERVAVRLGAGAGPPGAPGDTLGPVSTDLRIGRLDLGGATLTEARVQAAPTDSGGWDLRVASRELAGQVRLPGRGAPASPLDLNLERLDLKALVPVADDPDAAPAPAPARAAPARRPPSLDLRVADLRWGAAGLGRLGLEVRSDTAGVRVPRINLEGPGDTRLTGDADWLAAPGGGRGRLALDLKSADTGPLLRALDYAPLLSRAPVDARLRLTWPGGFAAFALRRATGRIELNVGPGRLLDVDPGMGRVLGFLNLGELRRRLSLDFTDLYEQGFGFERITGRIAVGSGQARLQTFEIAGPSSDIRVSGFADLRTRTYDQTVTVVPSIGTSVALASGVAGGPVVGAAVYLVDRLSGGALDRLASYQYRMTGPWTKPELTRLGWDPFAGGARSGAGQGRGTGGTPPGGQAAPAPRRPGGDNLFLD